ncbi:MAG TPA: hypothetical protein VN924_09710 [Bryobacteraceae bacterium]|nr:hypothetical protein [Bryobacteraceae bacterium]
MELLNRYLHAVRGWLPKPQQDDIIAELAEDLRSQIEDREAELGHPLDDDGVAAILKRRGNPMLVAAGYLPQRSLIGPVLFPVYQFILVLVILWILPSVFILIVGPATILSGRDPLVALIETLWTLLMSAVFAFGVITLVFAILERYPPEAMLKWEPRRLPRVPLAKAVTFPQPVSRYKAIAEVLTAVCASVAWIDVMWFRTSFHFGGVAIALAPIWRSFFWPILLVAFSGIPSGLIGWLRPWWMRTRAHSLVRLAADAIALVLTVALANMGPWVHVSGTNLPVAGLADANHWANVGTRIGLAALGVIMLGDGAQEAHRLVRREPAAGQAPVAVRR